MSETPIPTLAPRPRGEENARKWRKRRSRLRRRVRRAGDAALVLLAIFAIGFGLQRAHSGGSASTTTATAVPGSLDARFPPMKDVKLTGCTYWKSLYSGAVTMRLLNHTLTPFTYYVDVRWLAGGKRFSETVLHSKRVPAYTAISMGGFGLAPDHNPPKQHLTCEIRSVSRVPV